MMIMNNDDCYDDDDDDDDDDVVFPSLEGKLLHATTRKLCILATRRVFDLELQWL